MRILITGAGLSGATAAVLLSRAGHQVEMLDCRPHTGGNCYDEFKEGVTVHQYGPHVFHTSSTMVWQFLSRFTDWTDYRHRVLAQTRLGMIPIPWSQASARKAGGDLDDEALRELIFRDYSEKQWGLPFSELPDAIRNRVPLRRENEDESYFTDPYQGQPKNGYAAMFRRMLEGIPVRLAVSPDEWKRAAPQADLHIYTGKLDAFFDYRYGRLPYRSLRFEHTRTAERQIGAVINQCNRQPWTRSYDHAYFLNESPERTVITR